MELKDKILLRKNILGVLELWKSKEIVIEYQKNVSIAHVSAELFCQWEDHFYPDSTQFKETFNKDEIEILKRFDEKLSEIAQKVMDSPPEINEFVETDEWKIISELANDTYKKLKN